MEGKVTKLALCLVVALALALVRATDRDALQSLDLSTVNGTALAQQILHLASFSDAPSPAVTRVLFTRADLDARKYLRSLLTDAGLSVREDAMGNIFGLWAGAGADKEGAVGVGSHTDAIPLSGAYDGTVGVLGAVAAVQALQAAGFRPQRAIEVVAFTSEEPTRFGISCLGSRGLVGSLSADTLDRTKDENGTDFRTAATAAGYGGASHTEILRRARLPAGHYSHFLELHIEQGPLLERRGRRIGAVTAIAAPAALRCAFSGEGGHAGALLMPDRHDAGLAAAELALAVEAAALGTGARDTVATTGRLALAPNTVNSVPREAVLDVDVRDVDAGRRDGVVDAVRQAAQEIGTRRGVEGSCRVISQDPPADCSLPVIQAIETAAHTLGLSDMRMVSRAYHDALFMAQAAPIGMVFIPCREGWSHRPDEFAAPTAMEDGVKTLALTLAQLAGWAEDGPPGHSEL